MFAERGSSPHVALAKWGTSNTYTARKVWLRSFERQERKSQNSFFLKAPSGLLLSSKRGIFIAGGSLRCHDILLYS